MGFLDFNDLCSSLCDLVGADVPHLEPDGNGIVAFTVTVKGVDTGVVLDESGAEPGVVLVTTLGIPDAADELPVLRGLLDANFLVSGLNSPSFVRNPVTSEIVLHQSFFLSQVNAQNVFAMMIKATETVARWNGGLFARTCAVDGPAVANDPDGIKPEMEQVTP